MISATLITLNEEANIKKVLQNLNGFVDEIIMVDCGSLDKTVKIAKDLGAKVFFRKFDNFANQKNWATSKANGDWILSIDADEEISSELKVEIKNAIKDKIFEGFLIPRRNFIFGKEIKHSRWSPDKHIWLWKKDSGIWEGDVHEEVIVNGRVGELKSPKINYQDNSVESFLNKNDFYASLYAKSLFKKGVRFSIIRLLYDPLFEFFIRYIYKLGFLDGLRGFILSYLMSIYKISVWIKIYELQNLNE